MGSCCVVGSRCGQALLPGAREDRQSAQVAVQRGFTTRPGGLAQSGVLLRSISVRIAPLNAGLRGGHGAVGHDRLFYALWPHTAADSRYYYCCAIMLLLCCRGVLPRSRGVV